MPTYVIKPEKDSGDFYVMWSTVVESPVAFGSKAELTKWARRMGRPDDANVDRFDRADAVGSSALWPSTGDPYGAFGDGFIYEQRGWLPRRNLTEAVRRLGADENDRITDLLEPFEDETEVRP